MTGSQLLFLALIVTGATCAAKMSTLSRTHDFTPFGGFQILPINDIYITEFVSFRIMFTDP